ncbi:MAG: hypothetical protein RLP02_04790 [Coleofasciculus sp. C2-GNP5-27]
MEQNEQDYIRFIDDTNRREMSNAEAYDKALLTLSSVLLGVSLTFTQNVVPLGDSSLIGILIAAWILFSLTIISVISSFIYGQYQFPKLKADAKGFFLEGKAELNDNAERIRRNIWWFNTTSGVAFIVAIICFSTFIIVNVLGEHTMSRDSQTERRSQPASTFAQHQTKPASTSQQSQQTQKPQQSNNQGRSGT